jgi:hypothetical protein
MRAVPVPMIGSQTECRPWRRGGHFPASPDSGEAGIKRTRHSDTGDKALTVAEGRVSALFEYEIRVSGLVPPSVLVEIEGVQAAVEPVQTVLRAPVVDQSALHGIVNRLQTVGLELIEVRRLNDQFGLERDLLSLATE